VLGDTIHSPYVQRGTAPYLWWEGGEKVKSPLKANGFREGLKWYIPEIRDYLVGVVEYGYSVVSPFDVLKIPTYEVDNYSSCERAREQITNTILEDIKLGRLIRKEGPSHCVNARGAVPKRDYHEPDGQSKTKFRLITDMSRPIGKAVNERVESPKFSFAKFDEAVRLTKFWSWFCKVDLKAAYRHIPLHRATWMLFGFKWDITPNFFEYFEDIFLPFGIGPACWLFTLFTMAI
jgi:hypothetical protein